jgi:hypothetical protein
MEGNVLEIAFSEVQNLIKSRDRRSNKYKREVSLAKQEFLAEIRELAQEWFDQKIISV